MSKKGTNKKAIKVFERIIKLANQGYPVSFYMDFGGPALTYYIGQDHYHTYPIVTSTEELIEYLYNNLKRPE